LQVTEEGPVVNVAWIDLPSGPPTAIPEGNTGETAMQVIPNPMVNAGKILISLDREGFVSVSVFDLAGVEVYKIFDGNLPRGRSEVSLDRNLVKLSSGIYFVRMSSSAGVQTKKLIVR
jgi:hypothetical protein